MRRLWYSACEQSSIETHHKTQYEVSTLLLTRLTHSFCMQLATSMAKYRNMCLFVQVQTSKAAREEATQLSAQLRKVSASLTSVTQQLDTEKANGSTAHSLVLVNVSALFQMTAQHSLVHLQLLFCSGRPCLPDGCTTASSSEMAKP